MTVDRRQFSVLSLVTDQPALPVRDLVGDQVDACAIHQLLADETNPRDDDILPDGILVRSKSKVIVAWALSKLSISCEYEQKLCSKDDPNDFRLPDFTVSYEGDTFYWEHLGMLSVPSYKEAWERKRQWYEDNGYLELLITSEDGPDGSIDAAEIERIARKKILLEG